MYLLPNTTSFGKAEKADYMIAFRLPKMAMLGK
jgi:hypothetical protein